MVELITMRLSPAWPPLSRPWGANHSDDDEMQVLSHTWRSTPPLWKAYAEELRHEPANIPKEGIY